MALACVVGILGGCASAQDPAVRPVPPANSLLVADFETDTSGFEGPIVRDTAVAHAGQASGRMDGDFANVKDSPWITATRALDLRNPILGLDFWVKSTTARQITVRIDDSTKQVFQERPHFAPDGSWQHVVLNSFESGPGFQTYGGAGDGKVHWPVTSLSFILEKNGLLDGTRGTIWLDDVSLQTDGPPKPVAQTLDEVTQGAQKVTLADFEKDLGGFTGAITLDTAEGQASAGSAKMAADFTSVKESPWITATLPLSLQHAFEALQFGVKTNDAKTLTVRLIDATGQTFQERPVLVADGQWHTVALTSFESGPGFQSYGGAGDGHFHWPAQSLAFILEKNGLPGGQGSVLLDNVVAYLNPDRIVGKLDIGQSQIGNVFLTTESVRFPVDTQGDHVSWTVTDYWGHNVDQGDVAVDGGSALVAPAVKAVGYYQIHLKSTKNGADFDQADTTFAITTPFDLAKVPGSPFGMMTHFAQNWNVEIMPLLARMGVKNIRDELYWDQVEAAPGTYSFRDQFQTYMAAARDAHIDPLIVLSFANKNYDQGDTPYSPEADAAYGRYAVAVLKQFGPEIKQVEIWNEYNGSFAKGKVTEDRARYYSAMLKSAYTAIKAVRPDVKVVGVSAVGTPLPYLDQVFSDGALPYMDGVSIHPYRYLSAPEGMERPIEKVQALIRSHNGGVDKPVWITEIGWFTKNADASSSVVVTEGDQARYAVRAYTLALASGVAKIYWYLFRDYDVFATMGTVRGPTDKMGPYAPKPSYSAFANLTRQLTGARFVKREPALNGDVYSLLFDRDGQPVRVMWALEPTAVAAKAFGPLTVVDLMGGSAQLRPAGGVATLQLTDSPVYVWGPITALPPEVKPPGEIVAQSEEDFSNTQGASGWSYGFFVAPAVGATYDPSAFQPFPRYEVTPWNYQWVSDLKFMNLSPAGTHPGVSDGHPVWTVRRWTSKFAGNLRIEGTASRPGAGDGTDIRVFVDGRPLFGQLLAGGGPNDAKFDVTAPVNVGSTVDFTVDPGPAANIDYDATAFEATLTKLP